MSKRSNILVAVACLAIVGVVGCGGSEKTTTPPAEDTVAPAAVDELAGQVNLGHLPSVALRWNAGAELDLAGYMVYRSVDGAGAILVGTTTKSTWTDVNVELGTDYQYQVSAFDTSDNESARASSSMLNVPGREDKQNEEMD